MCHLYKDSIQYRDDNKNNFRRLNYYIDQLTGLAGSGFTPGDLKASLNEENFNSLAENNAARYLDSLAKQFRHLKNSAQKSNDSVNQSLETKIGKEELINLKDNYYNKRLEFILLDLENILGPQSKKTPTRIIQKHAPVYMKPTSKYGRAHFYAPYKQIGNLKIGTYWFNIIVLWIVSLIFFVALYYNLLRKFVTYFENSRIIKSKR